MLLAEAKTYVGKVCVVRFHDRSGNEMTIVSKIYDATYVPLYGGYLVTDTDDIRLDRINEVLLESETITTATVASTLEKVAA
jgi:hypothetical protein